jgi:hypothetical protein
LADEEETKWKGLSRPKKEPGAAPEAVDHSRLLQPIRLEKLLGRDESYLRDYPGTLCCNGFWGPLYPETAVKKH